MTGNKLHHTITTNLGTTFTAAVAISPDLVFVPVIL
jgi:hypothetical protein